MLGCVALGVRFLVVKCREVRDSTNVIRRKSNQIGLFTVRLNEMRPRCPALRPSSDVTGAPPLSPAAWGPGGPCLLPLIWNLWSLERLPQFAQLTGEWISWYKVLMRVNPKVWGITSRS